MGIFSYHPSYTFIPFSKSHRIIEEINFGNLQFSDKPVSKTRKSFFIPIKNNYSIFIGAFRNKEGINHFLLAFSPAINSSHGIAFIFPDS